VLVFRALTRAGSRILRDQRYRLAGFELKFGIKRSHGLTLPSGRPGNDELARCAKLIMTVRPRLSRKV
jgi:hypothetical protein